MCIYPLQSVVISLLVRFGVLTSIGEFSAEEVSTGLQVLYDD